MKKYTIALFSAIFYCASIAGAQDGSVDLAYRYAVDAPARYSMKMNSLEEVKFTGFAPITKQIIMSMNFTNEKTEGSDSLLSVLMTIDQADVMARYGGRSFESNTESIKGKDITCQVTPKGKVTRIIGLDNISLVQISPDDMAGTNFGDFLKESFLDLPVQTVKPGDKWEQTDIDTVDKLGMITITTSKSVFQFVKMAEKNGRMCAQITAKIDIKVDQSGESMGSKVKYDGKGKGKLEVFFAPEEGLVILLKQSSSVDGLISISGTQSMDGTASVQNETSFELLQ